MAALRRPATAVHFGGTKTKTIDLVLAYLRQRFGSGIAGLIATEKLQLKNRMKHEQLVDLRNELEAAVQKLSKKAAHLARRELANESRISTLTAKVREAVVLAAMPAASRPDPRSRWRLDVLGAFDHLALFGDPTMAVTVGDLVAMGIALGLRHLDKNYEEQARDWKRFLLRRGIDLGIRFGANAWAAAADEFGGEIKWLGGSRGKVAPTL